MNTRTYIISFTLIFTVLSNIVLAQSIQNQLPKDDSPNPYNFFNQKVNENDYLSPLVELQKDEFAKSERWSGIVRDLLGYLYSYTGDYRAGYAQLDQTREKSLNSAYHKELTSSPIDAYEPRSAIDAIARLAEKNQVVMINEEHDTPQHRAFTTRLLPVLYAKGFRYLAAETFDNGDKELMARGYPNHKTGFYANDPVFGEMIRAALKLGFKIVPYEYSSEKLIECHKQQKGTDFCQNERERGQAQNLYDRILKNDPQAKILVHVGRGHNQQIKLDTWAQMGWHFKEISGITPLSVNQMLSERSEQKYESGLYRYVLNKWKIKEPTVFVNKEDKYFATYGYNLAIFHPRTVYENGRPDWLKTTSSRRLEKINLKKLNLKSSKHLSIEKDPVLIQAFYLQENSDSIPADQIIIYPNRQIPALVLAKGSFRLRAVDHTGKVLGSYEKK